MGCTNARYVWIVDVVQLPSQVESGAVDVERFPFGNAREHACFRETRVCSAEEAGKGWKKKGARGRVAGWNAASGMERVLVAGNSRDTQEMRGDGAERVSSGSC